MTKDKYSDKINEYNLFNAHLFNQRLDGKHEVLVGFNPIYLCQSESPIIMVSTSFNKIGEHIC